MPKYPALADYSAVRVPIPVVYFDSLFNCRGVFTPQSCLELAESIRKHGLKIPVMLQPGTDVPNLPEGFEFRIVAGHRRFTAAKYLLSWTTIPAIVIEGLTEQDARLLNLLENLERKNLSLIQQAKALHQSFPPTTPVTTIAKAINRSKGWVHIRWRLFDLPDEVVQRVETGVLGERDLQFIYPKTTKEQKALAAEIETAKLNGMSGNRFHTMKGHRKVTRSYRDINKMITRLVAEGRYPDPFQALLWASGQISDDALLQGPEV